MPTLCLCGDYLSFLHFGSPYSGLSSLGLFGAGFPAFSVPVTLRGVAEGYGLVSACLALVSRTQDRRSPLVCPRVLQLCSFWSFIFTGPPANDQLLFHLRIHLDFDSLIKFIWSPLKPVFFHYIDYPCYQLIVSLALHASTHSILFIPVHIIHRL